MKSNCIAFDYLNLHHLCLNNSWYRWINKNNGVWIEQDFKWPCCIQNDGDIVYWRHKEEPLKKLTDEERKEIWRKENGGDSVPGDTTSPATVSSSPRKERPLRIFLDTPTYTNVKGESQLDWKWNAIVNWFINNLVLNIYLSLPPS